MKYLGIDYGAKRIGIAVSDDTGMIAFPLETIPNDGHAIAYIAQLANEKKTDLVVVGDTRTWRGAENPITPEAEKFITRLSARGVIVERGWEAGSSIEASRYAPEGESHNDAAAAAVILQRFLDMKQAK